jgi:O-antigen ligase
MPVSAFRMGQWDQALTAVRTVLIPLALAIVGMYIVAQVAVKQGWTAIFSLTAILFLIGFSVKRLPVALIAIVVVNILHGTFQFTSERWLVLAVGLVPFVWRVVARYKARMVLTRYHFVWLAFLAFIFTSCLYSENPLLTFAKSASVLLLFMAMAVMLYYHLKFNPEDFGTLMGVLFYVNAAIVVWSLLYRPQLGMGSAGATVLGNPNSLGAFLTLTLPYVVYQHYNSKVRFVKILWLALLGLNFFFLLRTQSRASILGVVVGVSLYWFARNRAGFTYFATFLFVAFVAQITVSPAARINYLQTYFYKGPITEDVLRSRRLSWERQWDVLKRHPLTGVGFGLSEGQGEKWEFSFRSGRAMKEPGSSLMMLLEGGGLPGAVLGFLPPLMLIFHGVQRYRRLLARSDLSKEEDTMCALLAGCVGGFINCQFEGWLYAAGSMWSILFWYQAAMLLYVLTNMEERELGLVTSWAADGEAPIPAGD